MLIWIDLETTGLDPTRHQIIEVACVITDDNLTEVNSWSTPVRTWLPASMWDEPALKMHQSSGLYKQVTNQDMLYSLGQAEEGLVDFINGSAGYPMAGSSVHFDRSFIERWMPVAAGCFHYRNVDVSTLKELVSRWHPDRAYPSPDPKPHRALPDIRNSINELRHYREVLGL